MPALVRSSDVVVCAPWYEPFSLAALEAMSSGIPVVATAVGGLLDLVLDGETGILVPPRSPESIARALRVLLADRPLRGRLGEAGARRARREFTWERVARTTEDAYVRMLPERRTTPDGHVVSSS
jgi:glycosyltransferase involved in cell wall biosynthesis